MSIGDPPLRHTLPPVGDDVWFPVPGKPHLERNVKGQLRTNIPLIPPELPPPWPWPNYTPTP